MLRAAGLIYTAFVQAGRFPSGALLKSSSHTGNNKAMSNNAMGKRAALAFAVGLACAAQAGAQDVNLLESIVVTADRQQSALRDLASSISTVDSDALRTVQHVHITEALQRIPGAWVSRGNGQEDLSAIRTSLLSGAGGCVSFEMSHDVITLHGVGVCNVNQLFKCNRE